MSILIVYQTGMFAEVHIYVMHGKQIREINFMELYLNDWPFEENSDPNIDDGEIF